MNKSSLCGLEMDIIVGRLLAGGIVDKFMKFYTQEWANRDLSGKESQLKPLGLEHLGGGGICYLIGLTLAAICFIIEHIIGKQT